MNYRIFTLDDHDIATSLQSIRAEDDAAAVKVAEDLARGHYAVEIWVEDGPLVARLGGDVVADATETDLQD